MRRVDPNEPRSAGGPEGRSGQRTRRSAWIWVPLLVLALLLSMLASLGMGSTAVGLGTGIHVVLEALRGSTESPEAGIVLSIRLPRTVLAVMVGVLLAVSGVIMQAFFRNVMAGPYLVGVSAGAALGAVLAMLLGWSFAVGIFSTVPLSAFLFALGTVVLIYGLNRRRGKLHTEGLLLSGIALSAAISALVSVLLVMSRSAIQQVLFWLLGSLGAARWAHVELLVPYAIVGLGVAWFLARDMDLLIWGDTAGASLGVHVERSRALLLGAASLMTAAAVAVCGVVGFVGLLVPHMARFLVGALHRRLILVAGLLGGLLLLWADVLARTVMAPAELPLGAITAIVGAPFLVYLVVRRRSNRWSP